MKSIREGKINLKDSYAAVKNDEVWSIDRQISPYAAGSRFNHDLLRDRRLLLHRREIDKLTGRTQEKGFTLVPTWVYLKKNMIKFEIALAKGKTVFDDREISPPDHRKGSPADIHEHRRRHQ